MVIYELKWSLSLIALIEPHEDHGRLYKTRNGGGIVTRELRKNRQNIFDKQQQNSMAEVVKRKRQNKGTSSPNSFVQDECDTTTAELPTTARSVPNSEYDPWSFMEWSVR